MRVFFEFISLFFPLPTGYDEKMEIISVINCLDRECVEKRLKSAETFAQWVHLDVSDARFTFGKSWGDASAWQKMSEGVSAEVHLMVEEPEKVVESWLEAGAKRLIIHVETINENSFEEIEHAAKKYNAELMLAISPETPIEKLRPYFGKVSKFQVLAVHAGPAGQNFLPSVLEKVKFLRREAPNATIEVDGGINPDTLKLAKDAGADIAAAGTYIFSSDNPKARYDELCGV